MDCREVGSSNTVSHRRVGECACSMASARSIPCTQINYALTLANSLNSTFILEHETCIGLHNFIRGSDLKDYLRGVT
jgi:hypothetical protein